MRRAAARNQGIVDSDGLLDLCQPSEITLFHGYHLKVPRVTRTVTGVKPRQKK